MRKTSKSMKYIVHIVAVASVCLMIVLLVRKNAESREYNPQNKGTVQEYNNSEGIISEEIESNATWTDSTITLKESSMEFVTSSLELAIEGKTTEEIIEVQELPKVHSIELELVYQHPELPTGCESVALTMLLKYYGFELDKTTIASEYLIYSSNFVEGFIGSPFTQGGAGIYSPGLTRTANKYLNAQESKLNAKNVTDSTPEELYRYVSEDTPVVVWNTVYNLPNNPTGNVVKWGEKEYVWDRCEHCMVLSGYDLDRNVVIIHDPIEGVVERDADVFWERYEKLGSMALIIR